MKSKARMGPVALAATLFCANLAGIQDQVAQQTSAPAGTDWTVPSGQKFILQLETAIHSKTTRKGDRIEFSTAAEVAVENQVVIPNKSRVNGTVTKAKRAGRLTGRSEVQIRLDEIQLANGNLVPLHATIVRVGYDLVDPNKDGDPTVKGDTGSAGDVGTIVKAGSQGAIIGVLTGGLNGAMYGSAAAVVITAAGMILKRGPDLDLPRNTMFEAQFDQPLVVPAAAVAPRPAPVQSVPEPARAQVSFPPDLSSPQRPRLTRNPVEQPPAAGPIPDKIPETPPAATATAPSRPAETTPTSSGGFTMKVNVRMVLVDTVVKDRSGRMIENLTLDDFTLFEDGVKQELQTVSRDELPLAIALVIDRSGSVAPYIYELRKIAERTLEELKTDDEVALFSFAADVTRIKDLTTDRRTIADGINSIRAGGGTDIVDALYESASYLAKAAPERRHAIILISDNQATVSPRVSEAETIKVAMESETVVYSIKTQGENRPLALDLPTLLAGAGPVAKITRETGGDIINATNVASFNLALDSVISHLRLRYCLGYYPSNPSTGSFHSIVVRLADRLGKVGSDYFIHARRGYYATSASR